MPQRGHSEGVCCSSAGRVPQAFPSDAPSFVVESRTHNPPASTSPVME